LACSTGADPGGGVWLATFSAGFVSAWLVCAFGLEGAGTDADFLGAGAATGSATAFVDFFSTVSVSGTLSPLLENELGMTPVMMPMPTRLNTVTETAAMAMSGLILLVSDMMVFL